MRNMYLSLVILLLAFKVNAQEAKDAKEASTKMDAIASKTGSIIKFIDYSMPDLSSSSKSNYPVAKTRIRKFIVGGNTEYFYQISRTGEYGTTASIAYEDLIEVVKAMTSLKNEAMSDNTLNPDYMENKFITADGFEIGYYIEKAKVVWFIVINKYVSGTTVSINDYSILESAFNAAKQKIDELKK